MHLLRQHRRHRHRHHPLPLSNLRHTPRGQNCSSVHSSKPSTACCHPNMDYIFGVPFAAPSGTHPSPTHHAPNIWSFVLTESAGENGRQQVFPSHPSIQTHTRTNNHNSVAQLSDCSSKFKLILPLSSPSHSGQPFPAIDIRDYDFTPWLADLLPPMRPLVWSLVLKIFPRLSAKCECEKEFEAALLSAHALPTETLKQIEVCARTFRFNLFLLSRFLRPFLFQTSCRRLTSAAAMRSMLSLAAPRAQPL